MDEKELFLKSFEEKLKKELDEKTLNNLSHGEKFDEYNNSADYEQFRIETLPLTINMYEKLCNLSQKILNLKQDKKNAAKINAMLYRSHASCNADGVISASILISTIIVIMSLFVIVLTEYMAVGIGLLLLGMMAYLIMQSIPSMLEKKTKAKANDEIIVAVFYIVAFMRFNSNFELAVTFAANYLSPPLSLDFKRLLWQLENAKYPNIKKAFDDYLEDYREENLEFLEAIYLIESSLFESEEFRRISLLDKSLDTILQGNYEKMLHFAQELRGKVSTFNMLGVVLPVLGLIILPLAASFGDPKSTMEIVFLLYNIMIPVLVTYFGFQIVFNRPSSVNSIKLPSLKSLSDEQKVPIKFSKNFTLLLSPKVPAIGVFIFFLFIGLSPMMIHYSGLESDINIVLGNFFDPGSPFGVFQEFKEIEGETSIYDYGPYGFYPSLLSLFIPLSFAFGFGYYFKLRYKSLIHLRDRTKALELQFPSAAFQLGNRINEGISSELAFGVVSESMRSTEAGRFFSTIDSNIKFNGMGVEKAIFDKKRGAVNEYPSELVISSMKIVIRAIEKGPEITAKTLIDLSRYLSEIHMSNERMKDLLAESISSMKGQASFLASLISGVVISIVSLVTLIMGKLSDAQEQFAAQNGNAAGLGGFSLGESIPTYLFQSIVGVYMVILIALLYYIITNLENGEDPINTKYQIGVGLISAMTKYAIVIVIGIGFFTYVGSSLLGNII